MRSLCGAKIRPVVAMAGEWLRQFIIDKAEKLK